MLPTHLITLLIDELHSRRSDRATPPVVETVSKGSETPTAFLQQLLSATIAIYNDRLRIFAQLDQKAQATAALSSVFLAALFAFCRKDNLDFVITSLGRVWLWTLIGLSSGFLFSLFLCLLGLGLRKTITRERNTLILGLLHDMYSLDMHEQCNVTAQDTFCRDLVGHYLLAISDLTIINTKKSNAIMAGQYILGFSIAAMAVLFGSACLRI